MRNVVYILYSNKLDRYYIGSTCDFERRFGEHNRGTVSSTKKGIPWIIKRIIAVETLSKAKSFEFRLKKYKRRDIVKKVIADGIFPWNH